MTKKRDEKLGVEVGPDEGEPRKEFGGPPKMTLPEDRKTPVALPDPPITAAQAIELIEDIIAPLKLQVSQMHEMVVGVKRPDGTVKGGIGQAVHDVNNSAHILVDATRVIEETFIEAPPSSPGVPHKSLPERIAEAVASKVVAIYQSEIRGILARLEKLEEEAHGGVNGAGPQTET